MDKDLPNRLISLRKVAKHINDKIAKIEQSLVNQHKLELEEKEFGQVTIGNLVFNKPKYVKWDNDLLFGLANEIAASGGDPYQWIECKLSVGENKYNALPDILRAKFETARSITGGKINIKVKED
jgi:hypothetical protein